MELFENEADFGRYRYSCLVTDLDLPAKIIYDPYRCHAHIGITFHFSGITLVSQFGIIIHLFVYTVRNLYPYFFLFLSF